MKAILKVIFAFGFFMIAFTNISSAHHVDISSEPTLSSQLSHGLSNGRFKIYLEEKYASNEHDSTHVEENGKEMKGKEELFEHQISLNLLANITRRFSSTLTIPYVFKKIDEKMEGKTSTDREEGFGDIQLFGKYLIWADNLNNPTHSVHGILGIKFPTGDNAREGKDGEVDEHIQPGTGSWDYFFGADYLLTIKPVSIYTRAIYRANYFNQRGYRYGNVLLISLIGDYQIIDRLSLNGGVDIRYNAENKDPEIRGNTDPDSGGTVISLSPGFRLELIKGISLSGSVGFPLIRHFFGDQDEDPTYSIGITYSF